MKPLYIFDLDGTLALTEHRQHILNSDSRDKWKRFFAACVDDKPNTAVIRTMQILAESGADIWIWSGRSDEVLKETTEWLEKNCFGGVFSLSMRVEGDFTPDEILKKSWLDDTSEEDRKRLVAVFDDRDKVVAMWRSAGVPCFQVAPGSF